MGIRTRRESAGSFDIRFDSRTTLVTLGCLFGAIYSSYLLYQDIENRGARTGTPMAKLERVEKKVRLKPAQSYIWGGVKANEDLYLKDSVQTPPTGAASIRFTDGTRLEIGENSLVIIDSVENLSLNFLRGSVIVHSQSGDSRITVGQDGKTTVENLPVRLISPEALSGFYVGQGALRTIDFSWDTNLKPGEDTPDAVEISTDRDFRVPNVETVKVESGRKVAAAQLHAGDYFWRLSAHGKQVTGASQFKIEEALPLKPLFPTASEKVTSFGDDGAVQFRWKPMDEEVDEAAKIEHHLEVASDPQFKTVLANQQIAASSGVANLKGLSEGARFWRIVSHYPGLAVHSSAEKFQIEKAVKVSIELNKPEEGSVLDLRDQARFSWSSESSNVQYRWQVRPVDSADKVESAELKSAKAHVWSEAAPGAFQWRVQAVYHDQVVGESAWRGFSSFEGGPIALAEPALHQEIYYWTEPSHFNFKWKKESSVSNYRVEVASTSDFKGAVSATTAESEIPNKLLQLAPGAQFWRVKGFDSSQHLVKMSEIHEFAYGPFPLLRAPASAKPDPGSVINPLETEKNPIISWTPVDKAQSYELQVKKGDKVFLEQNLKDTQLELKDLDAGKYQYSIRAIDQAQRQGEPLANREFEINFGDPLGAPEATSPEVQ